MTKSMQSLHCSSVRNMLSHLHRQTLKQNRKAQRLANMYKIRNGQVVLDNHESPLDPQSSSLRRSHQERHEVPSSRANCHKFSYIPSDKFIIGMHSLPMSARHLAWTCSRGAYRITCKNSHEAPACTSTLIYSIRTISLRNLHRNKLNINLMKQTKLTDRHVYS